MVKAGKKIDYVSEKLNLMLKNFEILERKKK